MRVRYDGSLRMTRHLIVALLASFVDATRVAVAVAVVHAVGVVALPAARLFGCSCPAI